MVNEILNKIIKNYGAKFSDDLIKYDIYSRFNADDFGVIKKALALKEHRLLHIECLSCDEICNVKFDDKIKFIHCIKCDAGRVNLNKEQDLAYFLEFEKLADFVANLLGISVNKGIVIKTKELVYLGDLKLGENKGFSCSFYLSRITHANLIAENIKVKNNNICFIINLGNRKLDLPQESFIESDLQSIILYDKKLKKFILNEDYFLELTQLFLIKHEVDNKFAILKEYNKKYANGGSNKRAKEKNFFIAKFRRIKEINPPKKDDDIILEIWEESKNKELNNLSKMSGLKTLKRWQKKIYTSI